jgi:hypothetical protein
LEFIEKTTVLLTDLVGPRYSAAALEDVYRRRWQVEEYYKIENDSVFTIGQCRAKSADGVKQEIAAFAGRALPPSRRRGGQTRRVPSGQNLAATGMLRLARCLLIAGFMDDEAAATRAIQKTIVVLARRRIPDRLGRRHPRISFKPRKRWHSPGNSGTKRRSKDRQSSSLSRNPGR